MLYSAYTAVQDFYKGCDETFKWYQINIEQLRDNVNYVASSDCTTDIPYNNKT